MLGSDFFLQLLQTALLDFAQGSICSIGLGENRALLSAVSCPESNDFVCCDTFLDCQVKHCFLKKAMNNVNNAQSEIPSKALGELWEAEGELSGWGFCVSQRGCVLFLRNGNVYIKYTYLRLLNIRCQNRSVLLSLRSCLKWKCTERRCEGSRAQRGTIGEALSCDAGSPLTLRFCICRPRKTTVLQPWETRALTLNWWRRLSAKIRLEVFCTLLFLFTFWYTELLLI